VSVLVFDVAGRLVDSMVEKPLPAGISEISYDGSALAPGTYVYVLRTAAGEISRILTIY